MFQNLRGLILLFFLGCCPPEKGLNIDGVEPPQYSDVIIQTAASHGCQIEGHITWYEDQIPGWTPRYAGLCWWNDCSFDIKLVWREDVFATALCHELSHWCHKEKDELKTSEYASQLCREVGLKVGYYQ